MSEDRVRRGAEAIRASRRHVTSQSPYDTVTTRIDIVLPPDEELARIAQQPCEDRITELESTLRELMAALSLIRDGDYCAAGYEVWTPDGSKSPEEIAHAALEKAERVLKGEKP